MNKREIDVLDKACQITGTDPRTISPENPFTKSGKTAQLIQMAASEIDPQQAAMWRQATPGGQLSVATLSEMQAGGQLSPAAMQELWEKDPQFVVDVQKQQKGNEENLLAKYEAEADRMRRAREGDEAVDRQNAKAEADAKARAESAERARQLQQRIDQRRANTDRMAGQVIQ